MNFGIYDLELKNKDLQLELLKKQKEIDKENKKNNKFSGIHTVIYNILHQDNSWRPNFIKCNMVADEEEEKILFKENNKMGIQSSYR